MLRNTDSKGANSAVLGLCNYSDSDSDDEPSKDVELVHLVNTSKKQSQLDCSIIRKSSHELKKSGHLTSILKTSKRTAESKIKKNIDNNKELKNDSIKTIKTDESEHQERAAVLPAVKESQCFSSLLSKSDGARDVAKFADNISKDNVADEVDGLPLNEECVVGKDKTLTRDESTIPAFINSGCETSNDDEFPDKVEGDNVAIKTLPTDSKQSISGVLQTVSTCSFVDDAIKPYGNKALECQSNSEEIQRVKILHNEVLDAEKFEISSFLEDVDSLNKGTSSSGRNPLQHNQIPSASHLASVTSVHEDEAVSSTTDALLDSTNVTSSGSVSSASWEKKPANFNLCAAKCNIIPLNKSVQTDSSLLESKIFKSFTHDLEDSKSSRGYCSVDNLASMDLDSEHGWLDLLVRQLKIRDSLLEELSARTEGLRQHGVGLEMDADYLQLKITCLEAEVKKLKSQVKKKRKNTARAIQTDSSGPVCSYGDWQAWYSSQAMGYNEALWTSTSQAGESLTEAEGVDGLVATQEEDSDRGTSKKDALGPSTIRSHEQQDDTSAKVKTSLAPLGEESIVLQASSTLTGFSKQGTVTDLKIGAELPTAHLKEASVHPRGTDVNAALAETGGQDPIAALIPMEEETNLSVLPSERCKSDESATLVQKGGRNLSPIFDHMGGTDSITTLVQREETDISATAAKMGRSDSQTPTVVEATALRVGSDTAQPKVDSVRMSSTPLPMNDQVAASQLQNSKVSEQNLQPEPEETWRSPEYLNIPIMIKKEKLSPVANHGQTDILSSLQPSFPQLSSQSSPNFAPVAMTDPPLQPPPLPMFMQSQFSSVPLFSILPLTAPPLVINNSVSTTGSGDVSIPISDLLAYTSSTARLEDASAEGVDGRVEGGDGKDSVSSKRKRNLSTSSCDSIEMLPPPEKVPKVVETVTLDDTVEWKREKQSLREDLLQEVLTGHGKKAEVSVEEMLRLKKIELLKLHDREEAKRQAKETKQKLMDEKEKGELEKARSKSDKGKGRRESRSDRSQPLSKDVSIKSKENNRSKEVQRSKSPRKRRSLVRSGSPHISRTHTKSRTPRKSKSPKSFKTHRSRSRGSRSPRHSKSRRSRSKSKTSLKPTDKIHSSRRSGSRSRRRSTSRENSKKRKIVSDTGKRRNPSKERSISKTASKKTHKKKSKKEKKSKRKVDKKEKKSHKKKELEDSDSSSSRHNSNTKKKKKKKSASYLDDVQSKANSKGRTSDRSGEDQADESSKISPKKSANSTKDSVSVESKAVEEPSKVDDDPIASEKHEGEYEGDRAGSSCSQRSGGKSGIDAAFTKSKDDTSSDETSSSDSESEGDDDISEEAVAREAQIERSGVLRMPQLDDEVCEAVSLDCVAGLVEKENGKTTNSDSSAKPKVELPQKEKDAGVNMEIASSDLGNQPTLVENAGLTTKINNVKSAMDKVLTSSKCLTLQNSDISAKSVSHIKASFAPSSFISSNAIVEKPAMLRHPAGNHTQKLDSATSNEDLVVGDRSLDSSVASAVVSAGETTQATPLEISYPQQPHQPPTSEQPSADSQGTGFKFLPDFQLYYDQTSGYYYDSGSGLYYDSTSGHYCYFDASSQQYQYTRDLDPQRAKPFALLMLSLHQATAADYASPAVLLSSVASVSASENEVPDIDASTGIATPGSDAREVAASSKTTSASNYDTVTELKGAKDAAIELRDDSEQGILEIARSVGTDQNNVNQDASSEIQVKKQECRGAVYKETAKNPTDEPPASENGSKRTLSPLTLEEIERSNATIMAKARHHKSSVIRCPNATLGDVPDDAGASISAVAARRSKSPPRSPNSILLQMRRACALLPLSGGDGAGQVQFRKRRRTTESAAPYSEGSAPVVELEEEQGECPQEPPAKVKIRANKKKKKAKRKSMEGLEEGECSSDSPTEADDVSPSPAAAEVDSLSYEEQLRQRITSRLLQRRSEEEETSPKEECSLLSPASPASSLSSVGEDLSGNDLNRSASAANATSLGDEEEETEESLWDMDYAQHLRRKEFLGNEELAPSLRLMVVGLGPAALIPGGGPAAHPLAPLPPPKGVGRRSSNKKLETLHLVTKDGADVGRLSKNGVHLPHISVSKEHARIHYCSSGAGDHHYFIRDLGSNNGTFVNGARLSVSKTASGPAELGHGWLLTIGEVQLQVHLHPGHLTCNTCEPGLMAPSRQEPEVSSPPLSGEQQRRTVSSAMRRKYGLGREGVDNSSSSHATARAADHGYTDRADSRRMTIGSDNPYEKTHVASAHESLSSSNKGFKLLRKMGWAEGSGLGKTTAGRLEPVLVESRPGGAGLGAVSGAQAPPTQRSKLLEIVKRRYQDSK